MFPCLPFVLAVCVGRVYVGRIPIIACQYRNKTALIAAQ